MFIAKYLIVVILCIQRDLIAVQEEEIRKYKDSLVTGLAKNREGNPAELVRLCTEAVRAKKSSSATNFNRLLAVANPANGPEFFHEV